MPCGSGAKPTRKQIVADFVALLSMPNVATNVTDVEKNAAYIEGLLKPRGFRRQLRAEPGTPPSVFARDENPRCDAHSDLLRAL